MSGRLSILAAFSACYVAVLLGAAPALADAGIIGFRNETPIPVIVQGSTVTNNQERRGAPLNINPREAAYSPLGPPSQIGITVYDPQGRVMFRGQTNYVGKDLYFSIQVDAAAMGADKLLKVKLVPVTKPTSSPTVVVPSVTPPATSPPTPKKQ